jgi:hypothetical protein
MGRRLPLPAVMGSLSFGKHNNLGPKASRGAVETLERALFITFLDSLGDFPLVPMLAQSFFLQRDRFGPETAH